MSDASQMHARSGFLTQLARDRRGNVLLITAAAMIPLIGMVGSGIDMSRAYMARARLQQACDAGALAGRRAMTSGTVDSAVTAEALKFFRFNYPSGTDGVAGTAAFGTKGFTPTVYGSANATVNMSASTTIPTTLMTILGFKTLPLSVTCSSKLDFVNTDIVLVLDTTGSMICAPSESSCTNTSEKSTSKIVALRAAVLSLYDTLKPIQDQLAAVGLRLRFSVVPYASSINVGKVLRNASSSYVVGDNWTYQSRVARYQHTKTGETTSSCSARGVTGGTGTTSNRQGSNSSNYTYTCTWTDETSSGNNATFYGWTYKPVTYDVSSYVAGGTVDTPWKSISGTGNTSAVWPGCIEERQTTNAITGSSTSIPSAAMDLDPDLVPTSDKATKWKPYWPEMEYEHFYDYLDQSNVSSAQWPLLYNDTLMHPQVACPAAATRLQGWTRDALSTYLNTLSADGGTYHDNGMMWGIRMLSGAGVFSTDNPSTYGGMPVSKYIIFMTDGALDTGYSTLYTTYGIEQWDARVTAGGSSSNETDQYNRHLNRFGLLCTTAKNRGISVWVVAFAQALTTSLNNCATNAAQASTSADQASLNAKFVQIGQNIGALRLVQ